MLISLNRGDLLARYRQSKAAEPVKSRCTWPCGRRLGRLVIGRRVSSCGFFIFF